MTQTIKSRRGLLRVYEGAAPEVRDYFAHLPSLVSAYPLDVSLAYAFARLELGQNMALYCGVVKLHRVDGQLARSAVSTHHMTRKGYMELFERVFGFGLPRSALEDLRTAENTRDAVMHGKPTTDDRLRNAIARVLEYADAVNATLNAKCRLKPYGNLRGFKGRKTSLDKKTSRWVLKGMGFEID